MIEIIEADPVSGREIVAVRQDGTVTEEEFVALAAAIGRRTTARVVALLLDWRSVEHWPFTASQSFALTARREMAPALQCAAIVHDHRLKRQAAWLGAVLREEGVVVRSWLPRDFEPAKAWVRAQASSPLH